MASRRGAVKVNPVTGKMEKIDPNEKLPEGKHRDGCLLVDDRYVNAAKDLGLGGANGAFGAGHLAAVRLLLPTCLCLSRHASLGPAFGRRRA
jgi:hypothetical protein